MKKKYILGVFVSTFFLIQFEFFALLLIYTIFSFLELENLGDLFCLAASVIIMIAHFITTFKSLKHIDNDEINFETLLKEKKSKNIFLNNPFLLGFVWRLINEWHFISRVAQLKYK